MPGDVDRRGRDVLGEVVEVEARPVGQRGQAGQVLVLGLERAARPGVEDRVPAVDAGARGVDRQAEPERAQRDARQERAARQLQQRRPGGGEPAERRRGGDGPGAHARHPAHHERRRRRAEHGAGPLDEQRRRPSNRAASSSVPSSSRRSVTRATLCDPGHVRRPVLVVLAAAALSGCGSETVHELPPAAEPAHAPALTAAPAGRVVRVGAAPEGLAADPGTHTFAVALRDPDELALVDARVRPGARARPAARRPAPPRLRRRRRDVPGPGRDRPAARSRSRRRGAVVSDVAVGDHPHDVAAVGGRTFVGNERANTVSVIEGVASGREVRASPRSRAG